MTGTLSLLGAIDRLYAGVVMHPEAWSTQELADWADDLAQGGLTRDQARAVRRCIRMAERLREFWSSGSAAVAADDWRTRVDVALGARAWRPTLELAQAGLTAEPSPQLFDEVKERFRVVNSATWLEGVDYNDWSQRQRRLEG